MPGTAANMDEAEQVAREALKGAQRAAGRDCD
jgi:hypothetical protein